MADKYNIKVNPPKLDSEAIRKHMDFDKILEQATPSTTTKVRRLPNVLISVVAASITLLLGYNVLFKESLTSINTNEEAVLFPQLAELRSPFDAIDKPYSQLSVMDAAIGDTLKHLNGQIIVPAGAFVDEFGSLVEGKVDIEYRELDTHTEIFLAGVPQGLEPTKGWRSAGMVEIRGIKEGKPVFINEGKPLKVALIAEVAPNVNVEELKVYAMSGDSKNWSYAAIDSVEVVDGNTLAQSTSASTSDGQLLDLDLVKKQQAKIRRKYIRKNKLTAPVRPLARADVPTDKTFAFLRESDGNVPTFKGQSNVHFLIDKTFLQKHSPSDKQWSEYKIEENKKGGYTLTLGYNGESYSSTVEPAVPATKENMEDYQKAMETYNKALVAIEPDIRTELQAWKSAQIANAKPINKQVVHHFEVEQFGVWNCAELVDVSDFETKETSYQGENGKPIDLEEVFVSNKTRNVYYSAKHKALNRTLRLNTADENKIWALTKENELVVAEKIIPKLGGKQIIIFTFPEKRLNSSGALNDLLM